MNIFEGKRKIITFVYMNKQTKNGIEESKKKNSRIFLIYFTVLVYVLITTVGITDIQLILNDPVTLPLINVNVNITTFFILSPILIILLFIFYNLHYEHLRTEYTEEYDYLYWPVFEFGDFGNSTIEKKILTKLQVTFTTFVMWGLFPIALMVISFRYLESHNLVLMWYHLIINLIGIIIAIILLNNRGKYGYKTILLSEGIILLIIILFYMAMILIVGKSFGRIIDNDIFPGWDKDLKLILLTLAYIIILPSIVTLTVNKIFKKSIGSTFSLNIWLSLVTLVLVMVHYIVRTPYGEGRNADLSYQIIAQNPESAYKGVYSVDLRFKRLENASFISSVLNGADMRYSIFNNATFHSAELDGADLRESDLRNVTLIEAKLHSAKLQGVDLSNSDLFDADLSDSNLKYANFTNCDLRNANLTNTILDSTNFTNADLRGVFVHDASWGKCLTLYKAILDSNGFEYINTYFPRLLKKR